MAAKSLRIACGGRSGVCGGCSLSSCEDLAVNLGQAPDPFYLDLVRYIVTCTGMIWKCATSIICSLVLGGTWYMMSVGVCLCVCISVQSAVVLTDVSFRVIFSFTTRNCRELLKSVAMSKLLVRIFVSTHSDWSFRIVVMFVRGNLVVLRPITNPCIGML